MSEKSCKRFTILGVTPLRFLILLAIMAFMGFGYVWIYNQDGFKPMLQALICLIVGVALLAILTWKDKGQYGSAALFGTLCLGMIWTFDINFLWTYLLTFLGILVLFVVWSSGENSIHLFLMRDCQNDSGDKFYDFATLLIHYNFQDPQLHAAEREINGQELSKRMQAANFPIGKAYVDGVMYDYGVPAVLERVRQDFVVALRRNVDITMFENFRSGAKVKTYWSPYFPLSKEQFEEIVEDARQELMNA